MMTLPDILNRGHSLPTSSDATKDPDPMRASTGKFPFAGLRTAALALKLAELQVSMAATGTAPLLLLDDVMSELDLQRRNTLLGALAGVEQAIITTTDWEDFAPEFRQQAQLFHVHTGQVHAV